MTTQKHCLFLGLSGSKHVPKGTCFDPNKLVAYRRLLARCQMSAKWHSSDSDNLPNPPPRLFAKHVYTTA
ncbi:MAG: hypothetical protein OYH77_08025 [Pseudomonadota bacterium]|nr:hypothetical protein [Pseudomonadota bacterium]